MMTMRSSLTDVVGEKHDFLIMMFGAVCEWDAALYLWSVVKKPAPGAQLMKG
jgi:hypothetical protein